MSPERTWAAFRLGDFGTARLLCIGRGIAAVQLPMWHREQEDIIRGAQPGGFATEMADEIVSRLERGGNVCELPITWPSKTPFTLQVMKLCTQIPHGTTITYGELAKWAGRPKGAQAVGQVMSHNCLPLVVPCHRVVVASGPDNYGPGLPMKRWLLACEGLDT